MGSFEKLVPALPTHSTLMWSVWAQEFLSLSQMILLESLSSFTVKEE